MKTLKLCSLLFCLAMLISVLISIQLELQADFEAVKGLEGLMK
jgi:hypothetical protein